MQKPDIKDIPLDSNSVTKVYAFKFSKEMFLALPENEQALLILLSHVLNEINIIQKLTVACLTSNSGQEIIEHVQFVQASVLIRSLIGKIFEAWKLYEAKILSSPDIAGKRNDLSDKGKNAESELKKSFGRGTKAKKLADLRNNFSFHYSKSDTTNAILESLKNISEDESWTIYLSRMVGNSCFFISERAVTKSMWDIFNKNNSLEAEDELRKLVQETASHLMDLFYSWIEILLEPLAATAEKRSFKIKNGYNLLTFSIPFFVREPHDNTTTELSAEIEI